MRSGCPAVPGVAGFIAVVALAAMVALGAGCLPEWTDDPARVISPRIIAIQAEPAESAPGGALTLTAVVAGPEGPAAPELAWAFCTTPRPLAENGPVSPTCAADPLPPAAAPAAAVSATVPADACRLFGPETPPRMGDRPPARPRDPDPTGGYYLPVRAEGVGPAAFGAIRILCNLASAPLDAALELRRGYRANRNPPLAGVSAAVDGAAVPLEALPAGREVQLQARWEPETAEAYLAFDPTAQVVIERRESLQVSWLVTAGTIVHPQTGRAENDPATAVSTRWRPPGDLVPGGIVHLWAVLRDSRGGVSVAYRVLRTAGGPTAKVAPARPEAPARLDPDAAWAPPEAAAHVRRGP